MHSEVQCSNPDHAFKRLVQLFNYITVRKIKKNRV